MNQVFAGLLKRMRDAHALWTAFEITGFNNKLEHHVLSSAKINPDVQQWLTDNIGTRSQDWDWMHYPNEPGSIYAFKDENKAILFRLSGLS